MFERILAFLRENEKTYPLVGISLCEDCSGAFVDCFNDDIEVFTDLENLEEILERGELIPDC